MICKKCTQEFAPTKGLKEYCSLSCRNSRIHSESTKRKIGESITAYQKMHPLARPTHSKELVAKIKLTRARNYREKVLTCDYELLSFEGLRHRIIAEQKEACNGCGLSMWREVPIPLELEHKDGCRGNNQRSNLEMLCPNCHALTSTWRGRNKRSRRKQVPDEVLIEALIKANWNVRQALLQVYLAPKGGNYQRCYKLKKELGLD